MPSGLWIGDAYARGPGECEPEYASLWEGLVGCWVPQMGPTGTTLLDLSGYSNHGTLTNMDPDTDWVTGQNGWALDLDGSNDYIKLPACSAMLGSVHTSISLFVAFRGAMDVENNRSLIIVQRDAAWSTYCAMFLNNNMVRYMAPSGTSVAQAMIDHVDASKSTTAAVAYRGNTGGAYYYDGMRIGTIGGTATTVPGTALAAMGRNSTAYTLAAISVAMLHNRQVTDADVAALHADPLCLLRPRRRWWAVAPSGSAIAAISQYYRRLRSA